MESLICHLLDVRMQECTENFTICMSDFEANELRLNLMDKFQGLAKNCSIYKKYQQLLRPPHEFPSSVW